MIGLIIDKMMSHAGWSECAACPLHGGADACPIIENRRRLQGASDGAVCCLDGGKEGRANSRIHPFVLAWQDIRAWLRDRLFECISWEAKAAFASLNRTLSYPALPGRHVTP
jgi:hypothetical protein